MSTYKRYYQQGGLYFFTVVTYKRKPIFTSQEAVDKLKFAIKKVKNDYPFILQAIVILPGHLHCLWKLPNHEHNKISLINSFLAGMTRF